MIRESRMGSQTVKVFLPPFDLDQLKGGMTRQYSLPITANEKSSMKRLMTAGNPDIVAYIDGCCSMNPGPAGSAVVFYKRSYI